MSYFYSNFASFSLCQIRLHYFTSDLDLTLFYFGLNGIIQLWT